MLQAGRFEGRLAEFAATRFSCEQGAVIGDAFVAHVTGNGAGDMGCAADDGEWLAMGMVDGSCDCGCDGGDMVGLFLAEVFELPV